LRTAKGLLGTTKSDVFTCVLRDSWLEQPIRRKISHPEQSALNNYILKQKKIPVPANKKIITGKKK
jgi:hypothetical protein